MTAHRHRAAVALAVLLAGPAAAQQADLDALALADQADATAAASRDARIVLEAARSTIDQRYGLPRARATRLSADLAYDASPAPGWRIVAADRIDWSRQDGGATDTVNMLKELYATWQPAPDLLFDAGRINVRQGAAIGYNPTDFFRAGANRSIVSLAPSALRNNRLGSVMARTQWLWDGGSLSALVAPKLASAPDAAAFSPDLGATNARTRTMLVLGQRVSADLNPQFVLYRERGRAWQAGANLTYLLNDATTLYGEWSGGRAASLAGEARGQPDAPVFRQHGALGFTYTSAHKISLTVEGQYNGAGADAAAWNALRHDRPAVYQRYRDYVQDRGEFPTRRALFAMVSATDLAIQHLDCSAFVRQDRLDRSRLTWIEARYHWTQADLALQVQHFGGATFSDFGAARQRSVVQLQVSYFY